MPSEPTMPRPSSSTDALRRLIGLRRLSIAAMFGVLLIVPWLLDIPLPGASLLPVAAALLLANGLTRLRLSRISDVS